MIHVSGKHKVAVVPFNEQTAMLGTIFPTAKKMERDGAEHIIVPHTKDSTKILWNMGMDVLAPIGTQYDWRGGTPFEVQKRTCSLLTVEERAYVLNGMGTGKTKSALWAWDWLRSTGQCGKMLVVAPLSTLNFTWSNEVFQTLPGVQANVLYGSKDRRHKRLADPAAEVYVINHDGVATCYEELMKRTDIDLLVIDELAMYRNGSAARTKMMRKLAARFKWVWGLTGSPTPNAPTDCWGQVSIITPANVPKYFGRFRDTLMTKITDFRYVPKPDAIEKVFAVMQPAVRYTLDDVIELPDVIERQVDIDMGPKQAKIYDQMEKHAIASIAAEKITAVNAGAVLSKLLQISTGWVYTSQGKTAKLDNHLRLEALVDAVMSTNQKVIVFVPFKHALHGIVERLEKEGVDCRQVSGDTPKGQRDQIFATFQSTNMIKVLAAHPQCMSHGLTLTAADTIIWFAPTTSLEVFEQANARIRRIGQKHKQQILMFQSTKAEKRMYSRLRSKQKIQNALLDLFAA